MIDDIRTNYGLQTVPFVLMQQLGKTPKKKVPDFMQKMRLKE